jgi:hypothetical protein
MPISGDLYPFTEENVNKSPDQPGVYALYQNAELTYYGMSQTSVRSRLQRHHAGAEGPCTKAATHYRREITTAAEAPRREQELLLEYQRLHGRLPRCNDRTG